MEFPNDWVGGCTTKSGAVSTLTAIARTGGNPGQVLEEARRLVQKEQAEALMSGDNARIKVAIKAMLQIVSAISVADLVPEASARSYKRGKQLLKAGEHCFPGLTMKKSAENTADFGLFGKFEYNETTSEFSLVVLRRVVRDDGKPTGRTIILFDRKSGEDPHGLATVSGSPTHVAQQIARLVPGLSRSKTPSISGPKLFGLDKTRASWKAVEITACIRAVVTGVTTADYDDELVESITRGLSARKPQTGSDG